MLNDAALRLVYHLENPMRQPWDAFIEIMSNLLELPEKPHLALGDWVETARYATRDRLDTYSFPLLLEFFQKDFARMACGLVTLDLSNMLAVSPSLGASQGVTIDNLASYVSYWSKDGFLLR